MSHERKFLDTLFASSTAFTAGNSCWNADGYVGPGASVNVPPVTPVLNNLHLSNIQAGTGPSNRIGSQVVCDSLHLRYRIVPNGLSQGFVNHLRIIVFADNECDGAYPTGSEVLTYFGPTQAPNSLAFLELGYGGRFSILADENIILKENAYWNGATEVSGSFDGDLYHERNIDLKGKHKLNWDMTGNSTVVNLRQGHIFVLAWWSSSTISAGVISTAFTNPPQFHGIARLRFRDVNSA